ncbi:hypothetical protein BGZ46_006719, partial [Entomortierella lignicola]
NENDKLQKFIETHCEVGESYYVNAKEFLDCFNKTMGTKDQQSKLKKSMEKKGFEYGSPKIEHKSQKVYTGLRFLGSENSRRL